MEYQFAQLLNPTDVCGFLKQLNKTYKNVKILSITSTIGYGYWYVFYKVGRKITKR